MLRLLVFITFTLFKIHTFIQDVSFVAIIWLQSAFIESLLSFTSFCFFLMCPLDDTVGPVLLPPIINTVVVEVVS